MLGEMRESVLEPDVISYSAGISACEKGGQWQQGLALFREMQDVVLEPSVIYTRRRGSACASENDRQGPDGPMSRP